MKRITIVLILSLILVLFSACQKAEVKMSELPDFVDRFVTAFYENRDVGTDHDVENFLQGENLTTYLSEKIRLHRFLCERVNLGKTNYSISTKVNAPEELDKETYYVSVAINLKYNYLDLPSEKSGRGTLLELIISTKGGKFSIIDAYEALDYYDEAMIMAFENGEEFNAADEMAEGFSFDLKERFLTGHSVRSFDKSKMLTVVKDMEDNFISKYGESKIY
ncbi:MAG TPA: hypothetical protein GX734_06270 [Clostridiaceae bacterium]|nr:hypothetical protein [Clostridiaceae bacterium]